MLSLDAMWRTSTRCNINNGCVQIASLADDRVIGVRDSKDIAKSPVLRFRPQAWSQFTSGVKQGRYDLD